MYFIRKNNNNMNRYDNKFSFRWNLWTRGSIPLPFSSSDRCMLDKAKWKDSWHALMVSYVYIYACVCASSDTHCIMHISFTFLSWSLLTLHEIFHESFTLKKWYPRGKVTFLSCMQKDIFSLRSYFFQKRESVYYHHISSRN